MNKSETVSAASAASVTFGFAAVLAIILSSLFFSLGSAGIVSADYCACGVDVYGLDVPESDLIVANIRNTGSCEETIDYMFYVNDELVYSGLIEDLSPGSSYGVELDYTFEVYDPNSYEQYYEIEFVAEVDCEAAEYETATDSETMIHIVLNVDFLEGWLDNYRCDGDWRQRQWQFAGGGTEWRNYEFCSYGCSGGVCNSGPDIEEDCGVEIRDIDTYSYLGGDYETVHVIEVETKNTGEGTETITLKVYIDDDLEKVETFALARGDYHTEVFYLTEMDPGEYAIEVVAQAGCGSSDMEFFIMSISDPQSHGGECALDIETFDYNNYMTRSDTGWVKVSARNTWNAPEMIFLKFYIDGVLKSTRSKSVIVQGEFAYTFYYSASSLAEGSHEIRVDAYTPNGCLNIKQATIYVHDIVSPPTPICNYNSVCEVGENSTNCPHDCPPEPEPEPLETNVSIYPSSLDIYLHQAKVITLEIVSAEDQDFEVSVTGVDENWLGYESEFYIERGMERHYIYVTPQELGNYEIIVSVTALSEGESFSSTIPLYVAPETEAGEGGWFDDFANRVGSLFGFIVATPEAFITILFIIFFGVIIIGTVKLRREKPLF